MKQLSGDRLPPLHTRVILPLMVSSDKDFELEVTFTKHHMLQGLGDILISITNPAFSTHQPYL